MLDNIIKAQLPIGNNDIPDMPAAKLDYEESNALRYCIGYVLRFTKKKLNNSSHNKTKTLLLCIEDIFESK